MLSAFGLLTKFFASPATKITLEPDKVSVGVSDRLIVPALVLVVNAVLIVIVPLRLPVLTSTVLSPAVNVCAELKDDIDVGK